MIEEGALQALARRMLADYDAVTPGTAFADGLTLSIDDAWRLQSAVAALREHRGEQIIGYKIGATSEGNRKMLGLEHPAWGRLWDTELHKSGVQLAKTSYANVAMEAEFAVQLSRGVTPNAPIEDVLDAIAAVYPVIEIHNLVFRGAPPHGPELLANNAIHAGVVRGAPVANPVKGTNTDLKLIYDSVVVDAWPKLLWPDEIVSAIGWLSAQLAVEGRLLKSGDLILTGAFGPPIPLQAGIQVDVTSSAFGDVTARFV